MNEVFRSTPENAITVTELNWYLKELLESDPIVRNIYVRGEISNFKLQYSSGHIYFSLKDNESVVKTVMFRSSASKLKFVPENGMKVIVGGRISVYGRDGQYQLYADSLIPDGVGALFMQYEQLKAKLQGFGYFDESHKKTIPSFPSTIGVVTSPSGAAIRDIINVLARRFPVANVLIYPAQVQGDGAHTTLIDGIRYFNTCQKCDVIIIGRGGGSIEDLWEFNNELLAKEIYDSEIPIISAVGHETDFTICDFVSDRRAPTPSAAAEIAVPDINELKKSLSNVKKRMDVAVDSRVRSLRLKIESISESYAFKSVGGVTNTKRMDVFRCNERMDAAVSSALSKARGNLAVQIGKIEALSPLSVISRGYAVVRNDESGRIVTASDIAVGDRINIKLRDGIVSANVIKIEIDNSEEN